MYANHMTNMHLVDLHGKDKEIKSICKFFSDEIFSIIKSLHSWQIFYFFFLIHSKGG